MALPRLERNMFPEQAPTPLLRPGQLLGLDTAMVTVCTYTDKPLDYSAQGFSEVTAGVKAIGALPQRDRGAICELINSSYISPLLPYTEFQARLQNQGGSTKFVTPGDLTELLSRPGATLVCAYIRVPTGGQELAGFTISHLDPAHIPDRADFPAAIAALTNHGRMSFFYVDPNAKEKLNGLEVPAIYDFLATTSMANALCMGVEHLIGRVPTVPGKIRALQIHSSRMGYRPSVDTSLVYLRDQNNRPVRALQQQWGTTPLTARAEAECSQATVNRTREWHRSQLHYWQRGILSDVFVCDLEKGAFVQHGGVLLYRGGLFSSIPLRNVVVNGDVSSGKRFIEIDGLPVFDRVTATRHAQNLGLPLRDECMIGVGFYAMDMPNPTTLKPVEALLSQPGGSGYDDVPHDWTIVA